MKPLLAFLAVVPLSLGVAACGGSSGVTGTTGGSSSAATNTGVTSSTTVATTNPTGSSTAVDSDHDNDVAAAPHDDENTRISTFGHLPSAADKQAITTLVKRYYAAAAAEDGAKACTMLIGAASVVEDYGHGSSGPSYLSSGTSCPTTMALLFKHEHAKLTGELSSLSLASIRLIGPHGSPTPSLGKLVLSFGKQPERELTVSRQGSTWKVTQLIDGELE